MHSTRIFVTLMWGYGLLIVAMLRWHISYGPPYEQPTLGLLFVFAASAAMIGILSIWLALGALHWAKRLPHFVAGASCLLGGWLLFAEWNAFLLWQMVVIIAVQLASLVVALGCMRLAGAATLAGGPRPAEPEPSQRLSIRDLLALTASLALFCAVLRIGQPVALSSLLYAILVLAGCCAAVVVLAALWIARSRAGWPWRLAAFVAVAPLGGWMYVIASSYLPLLFSWRWYAMVTTLELLLLIAPLLAIGAWDARAGDKPRLPDESLAENA